MRTSWNTNFCTHWYEEEACDFQLLRIKCSQYITWATDNACSSIWKFYLAPPLTRNPTVLRFCRAISGIYKLKTPRRAKRYISRIFFAYLFQKDEARKSAHVMRFIKCMIFFKFQMFCLKSRLIFSPLVIHILFTLMVCLFWPCVTQATSRIYSGFQSYWAHYQIVLVAVVNPHIIPGLSCFFSLCNPSIPVFIHLSPSV